MSMDRGDKLTLVHLLQQVTETSIPFEIARHVDKEKFKTIVISFFDDDRTARLRAQGVDIEVIGMAGKSGGIFRPQGIGELYGTLKRIRPDILHTHHNLSGSLGRFMARRLGIPVVVHTVHTVQRAYRWPGLLLSTATLGVADTIVSNSYNTQNSFYPWQERLIRRAKKTVIYNGIDIARIDAGRGDQVHVRQESGFLADDLLILNVARCVWQKDQATLLRAMTAVIKEIPRAKLVIVGDGPLASDLRQLAVDLGIADKVVFTGLMKRDRVYRLLHACDIFAMVSVHEGFCNAVVEALAACKPVVFTGVSALPEVVGPAGVKIPVRDPEALARAIVGLAKDSGRMRSLGAVGRRRAEENFSLDRSVRAYEDLYLKLLEEKKECKRSL